MGTSPKEITQTARKGTIFTCWAILSDNQEAPRHARAEQTVAGDPAENDPAVTNQSRGHLRPWRGHEQRGAGIGHPGSCPLMRVFNLHVKADQEQEL